MPLVKSVATLYQVYLYILLDALIIAEITIRLTNRKDYFLITICQVNDGKNLTFNNEYIMTTKEKAEELISKFKYESKHYLMLDAKQCALIAIEEILNTLYSIPFGNALDNELEYWEEVKQEIEKL